MSDLYRELVLIKRDLDAARSRGKLNQFFNSAYNASSLEKHNMALAKMIADSTVSFQFSQRVPLVDFIFNSL
jgi:hypothetical protein